MQLGSLKIMQWNVEGVGETGKKKELQKFLKVEYIDVCCIHETHLTT